MMSVLDTLLLGLGGAEKVGESKKSQIEGHIHIHHHLWGQFSNNKKHAPLYVNRDIYKKNKVYVKWIGKK